MPTSTSGTISVLHTKSAQVHIGQQWVGLCPRLISNPGKSAKLGRTYSLTDVMAMIKCVSLGRWLFSLTKLCHEEQKSQEMEQHRHRVVKGLVAIMANFPSFCCNVSYIFTLRVADRRQPIESRYHPLFPLNPTIIPPSVGSENGVPSSTPNGPKVLRLLLNVSDLITGEPPFTTGQECPLTVIKYSSGYKSLICARIRTIRSVNNSKGVV